MSAAQARPHRAMATALLAAVLAAATGGCATTAPPGSADQNAASRRGPPRLLVDENAPLEVLLQALKTHPRLQVPGPQKDRYLLLAPTLATLPEVTFGAGEVKLSAGFAARLAELNSVLAGRAVATLQPWRDQQRRPQAQVLFFGRRGQGFIRRPSSGLSLSSPAAQAMKHLKEVAGWKGSVMVLVLPAPDSEASASDEPSGSDPGPALTWTEVLGVLKGRSGSLRACFHGVGQAPRGSISVDLRVDPDGSVSHLQVLSSTLPSQRPSPGPAPSTGSSASSPASPPPSSAPGPGIENCMVEVLRSTVFPSGRGDRPVRVSFPLLF